MPLYSHYAVHCWDGQPLPEGNTPPPPKSGEVEGEPKVEEEASRMVVEEAKGAKVVTEEDNGAPQLEKGEGETRPPPPPLPTHQEERMPPPAGPSQREDQKRGGAQQQVKAPPKSGEVKEVPGAEEEVPKVVVEEAKVAGVEVAGVEVAEVTRVVAPAQPKLLTPPQPREQGQEKKDTQQEGEPKRGRNREKMKNMLPGKKRDDIVVYDMFGRVLERARSETRSSPVKRRCSPSPSQLQDLQGSSKTSRTSAALDPVAVDMAVDNNRNSLPLAGQGTDDVGASSPGPPPETLRDESPSCSPLPLDLGVAVDSQRQEEYDGDIEAALEVEEDWALKEEEKSEESKEKEEDDQVEEVSKQEEEEKPEEKSKEESEESEEESEEEEADQGEGTKRDRNDRKSESPEEVIEELCRRLTHEATGPVRVCVLVPFQNGSITHPAGSIMTVHRMSEVKPGRMVVTLDREEFCLAVRHGTARTRHGARCTVHGARCNPPWRY